MDWLIIIGAILVVIGIIAYEIIGRKENSAWWWPVVLVIIGVAMLSISLVYRFDRNGTYVNQK